MPDGRAQLRELRGQRAKIWRFVVARAISNRRSGTAGGGNCSAVDPQSLGNGAQVVQAPARRSNPRWTSPWSTRSARPTGQPGQPDPCGQQHPTRIPTTAAARTHTVNSHEPVRAAAGPCQQPGANPYRSTQRSNPYQPTAVNPYAQPESIHSNTALSAQPFSQQQHNQRATAA